MSDKLIKLNDAMDAVMWGNGLDGNVVDDICEKLEALPSVPWLNIEDIISLITGESFREDISEQVRQYLFYDLRHKLWSIKASQYKGEELRINGSAWIPCSERLPEEQGQYLVTFPLCNGDPWVYVLSFCKGKFYETDDEWGDVEYDDVTAWMPLPEPWKGADDEIEMF